MKQYILLIAIIAAVFLAIGCAAPVQVPTPTVTPTPLPTVTAGPTLIGGSDEAHIIFKWGIRTYAQHDGLTASTGKLFYVLHVNVTADKPVETSADWFTMEYKEHDWDPVSVAHYATFTYPGGIIGDNGSYAVGDIEFELPAHLADGYPKPVYSMDVSQQHGIYKVKTPVYGESGI